MGVAIDWTPELESNVLAAIEAGDTLRTTAAKYGMCAASILHRVDVSEEFGKQYAHAKQTQIEQFADEIVTLSDSADSDNYNATRLQVDTRKWLLSKLIPKKYGDKVEQFVSGPGGGPIQANVQIEFVKTKDINA